MVCRISWCYGASAVEIWPQGLDSLGIFTHVSGRGRDLRWTPASQCGPSAGTLLGFLGAWQWVSHRLRGSLLRCLYDLVPKSQNITSVLQGVPGGPSLRQMQTDITSQGSTVKVGLFLVLQMLRSTSIYMLCIWQIYETGFEDPEMEAKPVWM